MLEATSTINWESSAVTRPTDVSVNASLTLILEQKPVATVLVPTMPGVPLLPDGKPLTPGNQTLTVSGIMISYNADSAQIYFQRVPVTSGAAMVPSSALPPITTNQVISGTIDPASIAGQSTAPAASVSTPAQRPESSAKDVTAKDVTAKDVTSGAAAGLAVGCFFAGLLLAGLIFWFCWRKRKPSRANDYEASRTALVAPEKGFTTQASPLAANPMSDLMPLPLEDKAVSGEISKIASSIKNHIQSYYHADRVNVAFLDLDDIQAMGGNLPVSVETLSTLLSNAATREIALRFCVAWVVCSRILPGFDSKSTLLPLEIADCSKKIANAQKGSSSHLSSVARWRVSTAELMQSPCVREPFAPSDSRNSSIAAALETLENILRPFADSRMDNTQRRRNLEEILKRSALFAFTLFSQPSTWVFDWENHGIVKSGELCIFPALVQLSDETGQRVSPPRPFSDAVVRRLDG